jgi:hypothetical protein
MKRILFFIFALLPIFVMAQTPTVPHIDNTSAMRMVTWNTTSPVKIYRVWVQQRNATTGVWETPAQNGVFTVTDTIFRYAPNITWANLPTRLRIVPLQIRTNSTAPLLDLEEKTRDAGVSSVFTPFTGSRTNEGGIIVIVSGRPAPTANPCNAQSDSLSRIIDSPSNIPVNGTSTSFNNLAQNLTTQYAGQYVTISVKSRIDCTTSAAAATPLLYPQGGCTISFLVGNNTAQTATNLSNAVSNVAISIRSLMAQNDNYNHSQAEQEAYSDVLTAGIWD